MVALLQTSERQSQNTLHARGQVRTRSHLGYIRSKPKQLSVLCKSIKAIDAQLGSCSRDPIGYQGGWGLFAYVLNNPEVIVDPLGLKGRVGGPGTGGSRGPRGPRGGIAPNPNDPVPQSSPFQTPNPFPPGYPKPGLNPGPSDPNFPNFVKKCWRQYDNSCRKKYPFLPSCDSNAATFSEMAEDFAKQNVSDGLWTSGRYEFVNCQKTQEFNQPKPYPHPTPTDDAPCGRGVPGYTLHCQVLAFTETGVWLSKRDAISVFMCMCCDDNDPGSGPRNQPRNPPDNPHLPGGNRPWQESGHTILPEGAKPIWQKFDR